tara:strand:- start:8 stop:484 length:477 start_codon:yes stop_codon:yes gene_type:complete
MGIELGPKRGVANHYGVRDADNQYGGQDNSVGKVKSASWEFDYDNLPAYQEGNLAQQIPANSIIVSAHVVVEVASASGGTETATLGLTNTSGTVVDVDGLAAAGQLTNALLRVKGSYIKGAGALIDKTIGTAACQLTFTPSVALTAGRFKVIVHYIYN